MQAGQETRLHLQEAAFLCECCSILLPAAICIVFSKMPPALGARPGGGGGGGGGGEGGTELQLASCDEEYILQSLTVHASCKKCTLKRGGGGLESGQTCS